MFAVIIRSKSKTDVKFSNASALQVWLLSLIHATMMGYTDTCFDIKYAPNKDMRE